MGVRCLARQECPPVLPLHRDHVCDLDNRVVLRLREDALPARALDVERQNAEGCDALPLAYSAQRKQEPDGNGALHQH